MIPERERGKNVRVLRAGTTEKETGSDGSGFLFLSFCKTPGTFTGVKSKSVSETIKKPVPAAAAQRIPGRNKRQTESVICSIRAGRRRRRRSHRGLVGGGYQHWFCKNQQTLASGRYRFPLGTFLLAGFGDCRLLELHLLDTFSRVGLRPSQVFIFQNNKPVFFPEAVHSLAASAGFEPATFN